MQLKGREWSQVLALGVFTAVMVGLTAGGNAASAASQIRTSACSVSFSGSLVSFDTSPAGTWKIASSDCAVTARGNGATSGTFTGYLSSGSLSGRVTGTWSVSGGRQSVTASSTGFTLTFSTAGLIDQAPVVGSAYQGILSGAGGQSMFATGTSGQVTFS